MSDIQITHQEYLQDGIKNQEELVAMIGQANDIFAAMGFDMSGVADVARRKAAEAQDVLDRLPEEGA